MTDIRLGEIQGNILRGYRATHVRHLILRVRRHRRARTWLAGLEVTTAEPWPTKPETCLNVGISFEGLVALRLPSASLDTFPPEFRAGMPARAVKLGDVGPSAPQHWVGAFSDPAAVHVMLSVYGDDRRLVEDLGDRLLDRADGAVSVVSVHDGWKYHGEQVHFGYRDGIAQPRFPGVHGYDDRPDGQPLAPLGVALLGHPTAFEGVRYDVPRPAVLGDNGSFNAFRILAQDEPAFEAFLDRGADRLLAEPGARALLPADVAPDTASSHTAMRELVAAKLMGRWRDGTPLELFPQWHGRTPRDHVRNDFGFAADRDGRRCPLGAHIRRANPRDGRIVQRNAGHTRRIIRRGMPYGPPYVASDPASASTERGLLGNFICANLAAHFEAIQYDWVNLGLQDPRITGTNDPVAGSNDAAFSRFSFPVGDAVVELDGFERFVTTRGGAYFFLPSLPALRHIGDLGR